MIHSLSILRRHFLLYSTTALLFMLGQYSIALAACDYLSDDFSSTNGWTLERNAEITIANGHLDISSITAGEYAIAQRELSVEGEFSINVDVSVQGSQNSDSVGVYFFADGMSFDVGASEEYSTDGAAVMYYPATGDIIIIIFDSDEGWVRPGDALNYQGTVNSIGITLLQDRVVARMNGQDMALSLPGDFSTAPYLVDTLWLMASGTDTRARFDNLCVSPADSSGDGSSPVPADETGDDAAPSSPAGDTMSLPASGTFFQPSPTAAPVISSAPASASPLGFGPAANGGASLSIIAGLATTAQPVDMLVGVQSDALGPELFLFAPDNTIHAYSAEGLVLWKENSPGGFDTETILASIPTALLPQGIYNFYFMLTPHNQGMNSFYLWIYSIEIGEGGAPLSPGENGEDENNTSQGGTGDDSSGDSTSQNGGTSMEQEIRSNIDLILMATSGMPVGIDEIKQILEEKEVIHMTPEKLDLQYLASGQPVIIDIDFGQGYRLKSGVVMSGSARVELTNIVFSMTGMGTDLEVTASDIKKDGAPLLNGHLYGNVMLTKNDQQKYDVSGELNFDNLVVSGMNQAGRIGLSGTVEKLNLDNIAESKGNIILTFSNFTSGNYIINSGTINIVMGEQENSVGISTDLQTSTGPVQLDMTLVTASNGAVHINTTSPGTAGPYTLTIQDVVMDKNVCDSYPAGGVISMSRDGSTGIVTFTGACDGSYEYQEN